MTTFALAPRAHCAIVVVVHATAYAHTNIALIKYWGKRLGAVPGLNLPAVGSLSLTLDRFGTETTVTRGVERDSLTLGGVPMAEAEVLRVTRFLDLVRARAGASDACAVTSRNDVPTAAGLASSASAFAALALAACGAYGLSLDDTELSQLARMGSGSAARSIFGGFVRLHKGERDDGADCFAAPLTSALDVRLLVVRCAEGKKSVASTLGMDHTAKTSPYFAAWVDTHAADLRDAEDALSTGNLEKLGEVMEHSTLKMHATTLAARPGFTYWNPTTLAVLDAVRAVRASGTGAWATMDAGPHVKVLCAPHDADALSTSLAQVPGVRGVEVAAPGPRARMLS